MILNDITYFGNSRSSKTFEALYRNSVEIYIFLKDIIRVMFVIERFHYKIFLFNLNKTYSKRIETFYYA